MSDPTFNSVKIRHDTAGTVGDLLTLDMVSGSNGTGAALSFIGHSAVEGLSLALGRLSALRVDAGTVRIDLALIADPTVSSGDDTPPLLSLVTAPAPTGRQVITAPASTLAVGGALNVSGTTTLAKTTVGGTLSVSGTTTMGGTLSVSGATTLSGTLNVNGNVSLGTSSPQRRLHVEGSEIHSGGAGAGFSFSDRGSPFVDSGSNGQRWVWYANGSSARLWSGEDKLTVSPNGSLGLRNSENGFVSLTGTKYDNESSLRPNNLKLVMGTSRFLTFPLGQPLEYEFAIGHVFTRFLITSPGGVSRFTTNFVKVFSVNQDGTAFFAGGKGGYVVDNFVNRVGDTIEQGDVIVISHQQ
ncbi:MAG: hypothetical protein HGA19_13570, partial [Oscillochloris sp.]|nr:hypothetical protein [Oscillochloris sp.]